ncbi:hypothetical protein JR316_0001644 [Psilocybe cubensis]|uniref:Uncharacterized protein n=2 Tax=Psilocybe cubensis TaxID=181762 RepID=A0ACB8HC17_PSICU|nr:hypothetical protein JR316_0001644 [Psilocybe cubensis]KAH9484744.1 hypothetical protein JR316_0001644 [Psilocybe cubensis]
MSSAGGLSSISAPSQSATDSATPTTTPLPSSTTGFSNVISGSFTVHETVTVPTTIDGRATSVEIVVTTMIPNTPALDVIPVHKRPNTHVVAGVVTSVVVLVVIFLLLLFYYRRRRSPKQGGVDGTKDPLANVHLSRRKTRRVGNNHEENETGTVTPFEVSQLAPLTPNTPASSTDMSHETSPTLSGYLSPPASHTINNNERSSEKGCIRPPSTTHSSNNIILPLPPGLILDEKRAHAPYVLQWEPSTPSTLPPTPTAGSYNHPTPSPSPSSSSPPRAERSLSYLLSSTRPMSTIAPSIAPSEVAPAYSARRMHFRYRSGASVLTNATESIPPAYDQHYEHDAANAPPVPPLPPLPATAVPGAASNANSRTAGREREPGSVVVRSLPSIPPS